jgi:hypothetical protein
MLTEIIDPPRPPKSPRARKTGGDGDDEYWIPKPLSLLALAGSVISTSLAVFNAGRAYEIANNMDKFKELAPFYESCRNATVFDLAVGSACLLLGLPAAKWIYQNNFRFIKNYLSLIRGESWAEDLGESRPKWEDPTTAADWWRNSDSDRNRRD